MEKSAGNCKIEIFEGTFPQGEYIFDHETSALVLGNRSISLAGNVEFLDEIKHSFTRRLVKDTVNILKNKDKDSQPQKTSDCIYFLCRFRDGKFFKGKLSSENKHIYWQNLQEACFLSKDTASAFDFIAGPAENTSAGIPEPASGQVETSIDNNDNAEKNDIPVSKDLRIKKQPDLSTGSEPETDADGVMDSFTASAFGINPAAFDKKEESEEKNYIQKSKTNDIVPSQKSKALDRHGKSARHHKKSRVAIPEVKKEIIENNNEKMLLEDALKAYEEGNFQDADQLFLMAANAGLAEAFGYLGKMALFGEGCEKDEEKARMFFDKGKKQGCMRCLAELGFILLKEGNETESERHFNAYFKSAAYDAMDEHTFNTVRQYMFQRSIRGLTLQLRVELDRVENEELLTELSYLISIEKNGGLLHITAAEKASSELEKILCENIDVNRKNSSGHTPLHCLAFWIGEGGKIIDEDEMVNNARLLFFAGANLNLKDGEGNTPLHYAIKNSRYKLAAFMVENGADCTMRSKEGISPFMQSIVHTCKRKSFNADESRLLEKIVENGADVNEKSSTSFAGDNLYMGGLSALHVAIAYGNIDMARFILGNGADANIADANGVTPYDVAVALDSQKMVLLLEACGVDEKNRMKVKKSWHEQRMEIFWQAKAKLAEQTGL